MSELDISQVCHSIRGCIDEVLDHAPDGAIFVESGCYLGTTTYYFVKRLLMTGKKFQYYCIDNWKLDNIVGDSPIPDGDNLEFFKNTIKEVKDHVNIICSDSIEAIKEFADDSVYFAFLDDCHQYEHVTKQVPAWVPKMKDHSYLAGDDFYSPLVQKGVFDHFDDLDVVRIDRCGFYVKNPKEKINE